MESSNNNSNNQPLQRSQSTDSHMRPLSNILMSQSSTLPTFARNSLLDSAHFQRRTVQWRDNLQHVVREFQPLVETAGNVTRLLNRQTHSEPNIQSASSSSVVDQPQQIHIDIEQPTTTTTTGSRSQQPNNDDDGGGGGDDTQGETAGTAGDDITLHEVEEVRTLLGRYIPFVFIVLAKCMYDHQEGIFNAVFLFAIFAHCNSVVKKEATKRERRSVMRLMLAATYTCVGVFVIYYIFDDQTLYMSLIFIQDYRVPLGEWDLLWYVGITDLTLKLFTVFIKIVFTLLPEFVVAFQRRGKIYLFIESLSQFYRSLATTPPWLKYLLDSYDGTSKMFGVLLCAAYFVSKGAYLMTKLKMLHSASMKLVQNVTIGSSPSKEQIQTAGEHCPICHDDYDKPVLLQCRHIFCENCVTTWFDREQTCPLCRSKIVDDPSWRDGSTTFFLQVF